MLGNMIGGMPYKSNRDGLFGDQMANSLGSAINRPQEMMAQPMQQGQGEMDWLSMLSPLGSMMLGKNQQGRGLPALLSQILGSGFGSGPGMK